MKILLNTFRTGWNKFLFQWYDFKTQLISITPYTHVPYSLHYDPNGDITRKDPMTWRDAQYSKGDWKDPDGLEKYRPEMQATYEAGYRLGQIYDDNMNPQLDFDWEYNIKEISFVAWDLEVAIPKADIDAGIFPDAKKANYPISVASFVYVKDGVKRDFVGINAQVYPDAVNSPGVVVYPTESHLIRATIAMLKKFPLNSAYNGVSFDWPTLLNRAAKNGIAHGFDFKDEKTYSTESTISIDLMLFCKKKPLQLYMYDGAYDNYGLDDVCTGVLGHGKKQIDFGEHTFAEMRPYALEDSRLVAELLEFSLDGIFFLMRTAATGFCILQSTQISNWVRNSFNQFHYEQEILPMVKGWNDDGEEEVDEKWESQNARFPPTAGVYYNIDPYDASSHYPNTIITRNISYETFNCHHPECRIKYHVPYTGGEGEPEELWVCHDHPGLLGTWMEKFWRARVYKYKPLKKFRFGKMRVGILKVFMNSSFGVFGMHAFDYFNVNVPTAICKWGRYLLEKVRDKALELGATCVYGITDSVYLENISDEQGQILIQYAKDELLMTLEHEEPYLILFMTDKFNNYIGVKNGGEFEIKGMTANKENAFEYLNTAFLGIKELITHSIPPNLKLLSYDERKKYEEQLKNAILNRVARDISILKHPTLEKIHLYGIRQKIRKVKKIKTQPQIAASLVPKEQYKELCGDGTITYVKTNGQFSSRPISYVSIPQINIHAYIDSYLSAISQITESFGVTRETLNPTGKSLFSYVGA